jgi:hypothetical protein
MLRTYDDVKDWLSSDAPADPAKVARIVVEYFEKSKGGGGSPGSQAASLIRSYWLPRFPNVEFGDVIDAVEVAAKEAETVKAAAKVERDARIKENERRRLKDRHQARLREEKMRRDREERAEKVKKIVAKFGCTTRNAQMMLRDGVRDRGRAQELAELLGGSPAIYFQRRAKPGRQPDLVAPFLRVQPEGVSFLDFIHDAPDLEGDAAKALSHLYAVAEECSKLEPLFAHARERGVDADTAHVVWLRYKKWRVEVIADRAIAQIDDALNRYFDFG